MPDALRTYVQHIAFRSQMALVLFKQEMGGKDGLRLLITGGGAHNRFSG